MLCAVGLPVLYLNYILQGAHIDGFGLMMVILMVI